MGPALVPAAIVGGTALSYVAAAAVGVPALVPFLNVVPAFPFMIASLRRGRIGEAVWRMLVWAAALGVCATVYSYLDTPAAGRLFLRGEAYRKEMFEYLNTGIGPEGDPRLFVITHLAHASVFCLLALATGASLAMALGAVLMNYMAYYAGALGAASSNPWQAMALAWVPWALIRIASFVTLGVVLGGPFLGRVLGFPFSLRAHTRWLVLAAAGLALDIVLKWTLAPAWREMIRSAAGW
ncbi:MAG TPA: hypothetical protein VFK57_23000 [Vicinamibacterales bacterium]|nr:hypothetical protein [Vicinamibacterales bacterium]